MLIIKAQCFKNSVSFATAATQGARSCIPILEIAGWETGLCSHFEWPVWNKKKLTYYRKQS